LLFLKTARDPCAASCTGLRPDVLAFRPACANAPSAMACFFNPLCTWPKARKVYRTRGQARAAVADDGECPHKPGCPAGDAQPPRPRTGGASPRGSAGVNGHPQQPKRTGESRSQNHQRLEVITINSASIRTPI